MPFNYAQVNPDEKRLFIISLVCALIGVLLLIIISDSIKIPTIQISGISENLLNQQIRIIAKVNTVKNTPGLLIAEISDATGNITLIAEKDTKIYLKKQDKIEVIGKIADYKGKLEIKADYIRLYNG